MQLVDTHCHLDFDTYKNDLEAVLKRAEDAGIERVVVPGTDLKSSERAVELSKKYAQIFAAIGIHPHDADKSTDSDISALGQLIEHNDKISAIGEIGLDYFKKYSDITSQKDLFRKCLEVARASSLPVILHNREASEDLLSILKEVFPDGTKGVMHCFSADKEFLRKFLNIGLHISFTGNITFPAAGELRELIKYVPVELLLLETDAPFITPVPLRGKRNEPAYIRHMLDVYSKIYKLTPEDIARVTTHNANKLFELKIEEQSVISYVIRGSLYLNITNRCTNKCTFCIRQYSDYVKGHNLRLEDEPDVNEIKDAMGDISAFDEIVFCGLGEPMLRLDIVKQIASYVKSKGGRVRLTTNGHGDIINERKIAPELKGLIDNVSVSLNAPGEEIYDDLCRPDTGENTYDAVINFIAECKKQDMSVEITCLDLIGEDGVEGCRKIARDMGVNFRLRHLNVVG